MATFYCDQVKVTITDFFCKKLIWSLRCSYDRHNSNISFHHIKSFLPFSCPIHPIVYHFKFCCKASNCFISSVIFELSVICSGECQTVMKKFLTYKYNLSYNLQVEILDDLIIWKIKQVQFYRRGWGTVFWTPASQPAASCGPRHDLDAGTSWEARERYQFDANRIQS